MEWISFFQGGSGMTMLNSTRIPNVLSPFETSGRPPSRRPRLVVLQVVLSFVFVHPISGFGSQVPTKSDLLGLE